MWPWTCWTLRLDLPYILSSRHLSCLLLGPCSLWGGKDEEGFFSSFLRLWLVFKDPVSVIVICITLIIWVSKYLLGDNNSSCIVVCSWQRAFPLGPWIILVALTGHYWWVGPFFSSWSQWRHRDPKHSSHVIWWESLPWCLSCHNFWFRSFHASWIAPKFLLCIQTKSVPFY